MFGQSGCPSFTVLTCAGAGTTGLAPGGDPALVPACAGGSSKVPQSAGWGL